MVYLPYVFRGLCRWSVGSKALWHRRIAKQKCSVCKDQEAAQGNRTGAEEGRDQIQTWLILLWPPTKTRKCAFLISHASQVDNYASLSKSIIHKEMQIKAMEYHSFKNAQVQERHWNAGDDGQKGCTYTVFVWMSVSLANQEQQAGSSRSKKTGGRSRCKRWKENARVPPKQWPNPQVWSSLRKQVTRGNRRVTLWAIMSLGKVNKY